MRVPRWAAALVAGVAVVVAGAGSAAPPDPLMERVVSLAREHPEIWTGAGITRRGHVVVMGGAGALRAELVARAERARRAVGEVWGPVDAVILIPATTRQAATLAAPADVSGLAAAAGTGHVIVEPGGFAELSGPGRQVVLAHELTHVATRAATSGDMPVWLVEGFADYVGYKDSGIPVRAAAAELAAEVRAGRLPRTLPGRADFRGGERRVRAYEGAWLACRYVAARFGEKTLVNLYRRMRGPASSTALERVLGMDAREFTAAWREYVRGELA
jgi:hypothetical protein